MGDEILRNHCNSLLRVEKDPKIIKELKQMAFDAQMEGTEAQKNAFLAPAPAVPQLDREVAESVGKTIGLEDDSPKPTEASPPGMVKEGLAVAEDAQGDVLDG
jgi:hypothetical protein